MLMKDISSSIRNRCCCCALLNAVTGQGASEFNDAQLKAGIEKAATELSANKGNALVVCGSNDPNIQMVVNAINDAIAGRRKYH